jgi:hypothetical protein
MFSLVIISVLICNSFFSNMSNSFHMFFVCASRGSIQKQKRKGAKATYVALAADHLLAVVLGGQGLERRLDDTTTETEDKVKSRLLLDVVVGKGAAILELLAGKDQALLVWGNALLVLNLALDIVDGVRGLDLKGDGLARKGLDEAVWRKNEISALSQSARATAVFEIEVLTSALRHEFTLASSNKTSSTSHMALTGDGRVLIRYLESRRKAAGTNSSKSLRGLAVANPARYFSDSKERRRQADFCPL